MARRRRRKKKSQRTLIIAIILIIAAASFISVELSDTTGAFKLDPIRLPDLQIANVEITQTEITVQVDNAGTIARKGVKVAFYERAAGTNDAWEDIGSEFLSTGLKEGRRHTFTHPWKQKVGGEREIKVIADPNNIFREGDKDNNELIKEITAVSLNPDVYVSYIAVSAETISAGISNTGSDINKQFKVKFYQSKEGKVNLLDARTINELKTGATKTISLSFTPPSKPYKVKVVIDQERKVSEAELDRRNNILEKEIN